MKALALCFLMVACCAAQAQDARIAVQRAVNTEIAADKADHSRWMFHEVDRKPNNSIVQWVAQTSDGDVARLLNKDGQTIPEAQQLRSIEAFIGSPEARARQHQADQKDAMQAEQFMKLLPMAFLWTQTSRNAETTTFHFKPDPKFKPPTRPARVFAAMAGDMTISTSQNRIQMLKGTLIHDVDFGWGFLGTLKKGGWFEVDRLQTAPGIWKMTTTHAHIQGRALLFKTISEQEDDRKSFFTREPDNVTLRQAASSVIKQPNTP